MLFCPFLEKFHYCWHSCDLKWKLCLECSTAFLSNFHCFFPGKCKSLCQSCDFLYLHINNLTHFASSANYYYSTFTEADINQLDGLLGNGFSNSSFWCSPFSVDLGFFIVHKEKDPLVSISYSTLCSEQQLISFQIKIYLFGIKFPLL